MDGKFVNFFHFVLVAMHKKDFLIKSSLPSAPIPQFQRVWLHPSHSLLRARNWKLVIFERTSFFHSALQVPDFLTWRSMYVIVSSGWHTCARCFIPTWLWIELYMLLFIYFGLIEKNSIIQQWALELANLSFEDWPIV